MPGRPPALCSVALVALPLVALAGGCRDDRVQVSFRPPEGAVYRYETEVRTDTTVAFEGQEPVERHETTTLLARHTVLDAGDEGIRVRVALEGAGQPDRTFEVRYGPGAHIEDVEQVAGDEAGGLGLPEIVPAGAGGPPRHRLAPGDRWDVDERVRLPGGARSAHLRGDGRLVALDVIDGHDVGRLRSSSRLRVRTVTPAADGMLSLDGEQQTSTSSTHDLADGAVRRATATTTGRYEASLAPPAGQPAQPLRGTVTVRVRSVTRRVR